MYRVGLVTVEYLEEVVGPTNLFLGCKRCWDMYSLFASLLIFYFLSGAGIDPAVCSAQRV
jgi:hypothetical protein